MDKDCAIDKFIIFDHHNFVSLNCVGFTGFIISFKYVQAVPRINQRLIRLLLIIR